MARVDRGLEQVDNVSFEVARSSVSDIDILLMRRHLGRPSECVERITLSLGELRVLLYKLNGNEE